jgi:streptogramin lyase
LKALPRPKGKGTRVIVTTYDLPRPEALPHDATVASDGMVWYADFGSQYVGMLDPRSAKVVEYAVPVEKPGVPAGILDVRFDKDGNLWLASMYQGAVMKFDPRTRTFETWGSPGHKARAEARIAMVMPARRHVDGKIWLGGDKEYQLDLQSREWKVVESSFYGVAADSQNNGYGMQLAADNIVRMDAKTGKATAHRTPTVDSGPRRGNMDAQDRLWFAEFRGNRIGMFETKTQQFKEWPLPTPWTNPYDAVLDEDGYAWTGGMTNDRVVRLDTRTSEMTEYLLPRISTNIRRVDVDNSTSPPSFWIGDNLGAALVRVEPIE